MTLPTKPARINGHGGVRPPSPPKPKVNRKLKRFLVLEVVDTIDADTEEEVRALLPAKRTFVVQEITK